MKTYLCTYLGSLLLALLLSPVVILLARKLNIVDLPNSRKVHSKPIARIGGIAIFLSAVIISLAVLLLKNTIGESFRSVGSHITALFLAGSFIFLVGLIDDLRGMRARYKLLAQIAAASIMCLWGVRIESINLPGVVNLDLGIFSIPITIFWIVAITNAVNLIDGLDGLAAGISAITCGTIAIFAFESGQPKMVVLMLALLGSLSGFLFFNFNPAKIFMGDCGSMFLGFVLASSSVMCAVKPGTIVGLALPCLALGLPIFDTIFSMLRRYLGRFGIMSPDRNHLHHKLLDMGLRHRHAVLFMYGVTILAAGLGMFMLMTRGAGVLTIFFCLLLLIVMVFRLAGAIRVREVIAKAKRNMLISKEAHGHFDSFESTNLKFQNAKSFKELWSVVSDTAEDMGLLEISMTAVAQGGKIHKFTWRLNEDKQQRPETVSMTLPIAARRIGMPLDIEAKIPVDGSLESAGRRMMLLGRLVDEYGSGETGYEIEPLRDRYAKLS